MHDWITCPKYDGIRFPDEPIWINIVKPKLDKVECFLTVCLGFSTVLISHFIYFFPLHWFIFLQFSRPDNLMDGKRRRGTPQTCSPSTQTPRTPTTSSPSTRVRAQRKLPWTTGGKSWTKRNFSTVEPKATSTPTPKRYKMLSKSQIHDSEAPSPLTYESPKEKRSSPRKFRQGRP